MAKMSELDAAYRATSYCVYLPGGQASLRIGEPSPLVAGWLAENGARCFAILTAWNPGGERRSASENAAQQAALECDLLEGNYEPFAGVNVPDDAAGPREESCFVPDLACEDACALAEDYGQNAIVCGGADGVPHLVWLEDVLA